MSIFDKAKDLLGDESNLQKAKDAVNEHEAQIDQGVERAGDMVDDTTGGKFADKVDQGQSFIEDKTGNL